MKKYIISVLIGIVLWAILIALMIAMKAEGTIGFVITAVIVVSTARYSFYYLKEDERKKSNKKVN